MKQAIADRFFLSTAPASASERKIVSVVIAVAAIAFALMFPFVRIHNCMALRVLAWGFPAFCSRLLLSPIA
jgi:hypothetical protein